MAILKIDSVTKVFDRKVAVKNFSLEVQEGVIYGLLGPNGAGKTTTIRMVMNIIAPDEGRITVMGREMNEQAKDRIGFLPEERGLYQKMVVRDVLTYLGEIKGMKKPQIAGAIEEWLARVKLSECIDDKVEELSKGMQQKLQFASTLIHDPQLIMLDEPFSGLDPVNLELIKNIVLEQKRQGKTIIFSTHIMEQAEKLCDNICLINKGEKVLDGPLFEVKSKFGKNTVVLEFDGDISDLEGLPGVEKIYDYNKYVELKLHDGTSPHKVLESLIDKVELNRYEFMEPSLHDIFVDIVGEKKDAREE
ncbi:MAG TPA: ATP-binding cassette domain-containing protein, partial [candidate division Zixibacteria bacterium]|nr:ATP-binding cassette domain-containing protein [candidate division Zixibacteria bacterium]